MAGLGSYFGCAVQCSKDAPSFEADDKEAAEGANNTTNDDKPINDDTEWFKY